MRKKLLFSVLALAFALQLQTSSRAEAAGRCTIACASNHNVRCSSASGDCVYYYGAYDYIICDGNATQCPL